MTTRRVTLGVSMPIQTASPLVRASLTSFGQLHLSEVGVGRRVLHVLGQVLLLLSLGPLVLRLRTRRPARPHRDSVMKPQCRVRSSPMPYVLYSY